MKRSTLLSFICCVALCCGIEVLSAQPTRQYVDASQLTIINKAQDDNLTFSRLDGSKYEIADSTVLKYLTYSTGMAVLFRTDSHAIHARWSTLYRELKANMTPAFQSGLDLYIRSNGRWVFAGIARPNSLGTEHEFTLVKGMGDGVKECMVYLPMFNALKSLEIGVDSGAMIEAAPSPFKHKILFVGSSLTHGASASRAGTSYVAHLGRIFDAHTPNIGLSGLCRLDDFLADIICDTQADAYVIDAFSNPTAQQIEQRLEGFVERIVAAHPDKPIIFLQTVYRDADYFNLAMRKRNIAQRTAAEQGLAELCKRYKNIYFINPALYSGTDQEGTVDGIHLNDIGVQRTLKVIVPKMEKILKKYGIK